MRVAKHLWCIRVFKPRSLSPAACKAEKVWVNGEFVKASRELKLKDVVRVRKGPIHFQFEVIDFPKSRLGAKLVSTVTKDVTAADELAKLERIQLQMKATPYFGVGRPTKKDRRQLDDFMYYEDLEQDDSQ
ncbi:MAG: RNA-binding S4 domain-containing protein [Flavobacteriales bacterium]|nr:RNA-binding S4 domain-containing protein [Flavobacteriales bacterium]